MILGCHVGFKSEQLLGSVKEAVSYGANAFMFYTGAPQNTMRKEIDMGLLVKAKEVMASNNIDIKNVICHAPYIVNLANNIDPSKWDFSINFLKQELKRCDLLGVSYMVLHPGSAVGLDRSVALKNIVDGLNIILSEEYKCMILIETMAGKGTELGVNLSELEYIYKNVKGSIGFCLDTCHLNDSGIDIKDFKSYLRNFDKVIGVNNVHCVHLNDSKNVIGAHKDRHENIGLGTIGFQNLVNVLNEELLKDVPKILETPYVNKDFAPYKEEIKMLKSGVFDSHLLENIVNN